jgi:hypothetical protein
LFHRFKSLKHSFYLLKSLFLSQTENEGRRSFKRCNEWRRGQGGDGH